MEPLNVRLAEPERDAARAAAIYRQAVDDSFISFEEEAPDEAEMAERMRTTLTHTPWLVAETASAGVIGYAYASAHRARAAYRWSVDVSAYVDASSRGRGVGRQLYGELLSLLRRQRFVNVYAGIALPNPASVRLHESMGMRLIGVYERVGYKLDEWRDVAWYGLRLAEPDGEPPEPIPLPQLTAS